MILSVLTLKLLQAWTFSLGAFCTLNFQLDVSHSLENVEAVTWWKTVVLSMKPLVDLLEKDVLYGSAGLRTVCTTKLSNR